jgi:hypothetical protein
MVRKNTVVLKYFSDGKMELICLLLLGRKDSCLKYVPHWAGGHLPGHILYICVYIYRYIEGMLGVSSHIKILRMGTEIVPETLVSTCNQLTRLSAREDFIEFSRRESFKIICNSFYLSAKCKSVVNCWLRGVGPQKRNLWTLKSKSVHT